MRRQIKYEADYQQFTIMFNTSMNIVQTAAYLNDLISCDLSHTGVLESHDAVTDLSFDFHAFSDEDEVSKTTYILIQNRSCSKHLKNADSLFASEEFIIQKNIIGDKKTNSIYFHKNFTNSDFCFIFSFPPCQPKPSSISKLKNNDKIQTSIEINMSDFAFFSDLMEGIELHLTSYNCKNHQIDLSGYRKLLLQKKQEENAQDAERIIFPTLNNSNEKR